MNNNQSSRTKNAFDLHVSRRDKRPARRGDCVDLFWTVTH